MSKNSVFKSDFNNPDQLINEFFELNNYFSDDEKKDILKAWNYFTKKCQTKNRISG